MSNNVPCSRSDTGRPVTTSVTNVQISASHFANFPVDGCARRAFYFTMKQQTTSNIYRRIRNTSIHPIKRGHPDAETTRITVWPFSPLNADDGCVIGSTCANKKDVTDKDHHHHHNDTNDPTGCAAHGSRRDCAVASHICHWCWAA
jgi:hypothetical protein